MPEVAWEIRCRGGRRARDSEARFTFAVDGDSPTLSVDDLQVVPVDASPEAA